MSPKQFLFTPGGDARWPSIAAVAGFVIAAAILESCVLIGRNPNKPGEDTLKFSHAKHAVHTPDCATCHLDPEAFEDPIVPAFHDSCVQCHAFARDDIVPDRGCLECHHTLEPTSITRAARPDYSQANFSHEFHEETSCAECHGEVARAGLFSRADFPTMEDCVSCHFPNVVETSQADCFTCHYDFTAETEPPSHQRADWGLSHGKVSLINDNLCSRCHVQQQDCQTCHSIERPPSHNAAFRAKLHGIRAINNPISCQTCHDQDFCEACHLTTEPINHTAGFKSRPFLHCATCHLPLEEGNRCAVCHRGDPHDDVIARPPPPFLVEAGLINPSESCLPCHPVSVVPITHPYNTISPFDCVQCHRPL